MQGRLYTADEIFEALHEGSARVAETYPDTMGPAIVAAGANISMEVADILGFDMDQLKKYCIKKMIENGELDDSED